MHQRSLRAATLLLLAMPPARAKVRSFGSPTATSWPSARLFVGDPPALILNHTLSADARLGVMTHFWLEGANEVELASMGVRVEVRYQFDGEQTPSVAFEPAMACGQVNLYNLLSHHFKSLRSLWIGVGSCREGWSMAGRAASSGQFRAL